MIDSRLVCLATAFVTAAALLPGLSGAAGGNPSAAGAYCPLPEPGQVPQCLAPARAEFGDFFDAVETGASGATGELDDSQSGRLEAQSLRLEAALSGRSSEQESYWALSSLAYGYFKLAQRAAADPEARPRLTARLERWNQVLLRAYSQSESRPDFRRALRRAARDLSNKAPAETSTGSLLQLIAQADGRSSGGIRAALEGLVGRIFGEEDGR